MEPLIANECRETISQLVHAYSHSGVSFCHSQITVRPKTWISHRIVDHAAGLICFYSSLVCLLVFSRRAGRRMERVRVSSSRLPTKSWSLQTRPASSSTDSRTSSSRPPPSLVSGNCVFYTSMRLLLLHHAETLLHPTLYSEFNALVPPWSPFFKLRLWIDPVSVFLLKRSQQLIKVTQTQEEQNTFNKNLHLLYSDVKLVSTLVFICLDNWQK